MEREMKKKMRAKNAARDEEESLTQMKNTA
jgi:hypothetical protein